MPKEAIICQAKALQGMQHAIRTSFGVTENIFKCDESNRLGGIGQGSGDGTVCWHSHMLPLIDAFEELIPHRTHFCIPDQSLKKIQQWLIGFVDNNTIVFTYKDRLFDPATVEKLFKMADEVLDTWKKLVVITGGDIELDKSSISILA